VKTKFLRERGRVSLVVDTGEPTTMDNKQALAAMTLLEGTGCWSIIDIRLDDHPSADPWSASGFSEEFYSELKPESSEQAIEVKAMLKEYQELKDGTLVWCSFRDIVRGESGVNGFTPSGKNNFQPPVYHSRRQGLALLREIQEFWEAHAGTIEESKIDNPYSQPNASVVKSTLIFQKVMREHESRKKHRDADSECGL
jgi:hypothetical protein